MIAVVAWKWKRADGSDLFAADYVNRLRSMLERNLRVPHALFCVTDDVAGIDPRVRCVPMPERHAGTPRCRRRMKQYAREFAADIGAARILGIDLDVVIVDDITAIVDRPEPIVCWRVGYANAYCGSFVLYDAGALDEMWRAFDADPVGYPAKVQPRGVPSDQAMLNHYLAGKPIPCWTEADGFVTYFGEGYKQFEHLGVGPGRPKLPRHARVVVLGSDDKHVLERGVFDWSREHWR